MTEKLLTVDNLFVEFLTDEGVVQAVNGVSFEIEPGETLGIVGESGSGKSVTNLAVMGLVPSPPGRITGGELSFRGKSLRNLSQREMAGIRGKRIAMIFQDPMTSLNPFLTIAEQLTEVTRLHLKHNKRQAVDHAVKMLDMVGIPAASKRIYDYPHQFSGGMRQRVMIAMALSCNPELLIADEPTTALDVTIQAQILDLMKELQQQHGTAIILITHALGVVANICHRVLVMYAGKIVEESDVGSLFANPRHPYTIGLLNSVPRWDEKEGTLLKAITGQPPHLVDMPPGCSFYPRCPYRIDQCRAVSPELFDRPDNGRFACFVDVDNAKPVEVVLDE